MELDKRIKTITDILTVVNSDLKGIIGKTGYFGNSIMDFKRLDTCEYGELTGIIRNTDRCFEYENCAESGRQGYCYFIPEYYLNPVEPEKKYRPYTVMEFVKYYPLGSHLHFRLKDGTIEMHRLVDGYNDCKNGSGTLFMCGVLFSMSELYDDYEIFKDGEWQPFGVIEDD